jgi:hypothetical protein
MPGSAPGSVVTFATIVGSRLSAFRTTVALLLDGDASH